MSKFPEGQSGNPAGRPPGIKDRRAIYRQMIEPNKEALIKKAVEMALDGNEQMLRLLLDRLLPAKPKDDPLPEIGELTGTIAEQSEKIISLATDGVITPIEANTLLQAIESKAKLVELEEVKERLIAIEAALKQRNKNDK